MSWPLPATRLAIQLWDAWAHRIQAFGGPSLSVSPMVKSFLLAGFVFGQAVVLFVAGVATLWWSGDLMRWLLWLVGEEHALGAKNVIRTEDGGVRLTNPIRMIRWTLPFPAAGVAEPGRSADRQKP